MREHLFFISVGVAILVGISGLSVFFLPTVFSVNYEQNGVEIRTTERQKEIDSRKEIEHVPLPKAVKAIYMTSCVAGTPSLRTGLVNFIDHSEINAVVIDIKDYSGTISFPAESSEWASAWEQARCGTPDMEEFLHELHEKGIYTIGRITVFQDPFYTKVHPEVAVKKASDGSVWKDFKGLSFVDVGARPYWDHIITLAKDSYDIGFDELNFDYIRFPSDGNMEDIAFTHTTGSKQEQLELFFAYLHDKLSDPKLFASVRHENTGRDEAIPYMSADIFGMTTTNTDDLSIGQVLERALPYFDFIAPMVYPSHYPKTFLGLSNPNQNVYRVVNYSMGEAVRRAQASTTPNNAFVHTRIGSSTPPLYKKPVYDIQKLRPWLQDFDYGGEYGIPEVQAQIKATYDTGLTSWMIWDPGNHYTRGAYLPE